MSVFRKSALDKLSSPEQLDKLIKMTSPRSWMILAFFVLICASTIIWSVTGNIPKKIQAQGIILSSNGTKSIFSALDGEISDVTIGKDDYVHIGETIARISQSSFVEEIGKIEKQIEEIESFTLEYQKSNTQISENILNLVDIKNQITDVNKQIEKLKVNDTSSKILSEIDRNLKEIERYKTDLEKKNSELDTATKELEKKQQLINSGAIPKSEYEQAVEVKNTALYNQKNSQLSLTQTQQNQNSLDEQYKQAKEQFDGEVNYLVFRNNALEGNFNATKSSKLDSLYKRRLELKQNIAKSEILSNVEGKVLSVNVTKGNIIQKGTEISKVLEKGSDVNDSGVIFYVAMEEGKKLMPGMKINVYPTTVSRQEYGHMEAVVTYVSDYAVSVDDMRKKLGNDELINKFLKSGVLVEVDANILKDNSTKSGYYWSSKKGKSLAVLEGTLCDASITIEENKPITLVIPLLKEKISPFED